MTDSDADVSRASGQAGSTAATGLNPLGPFDPPLDFRFESEFDGEAPRESPAELARGRHAVQQRRAVSRLLIAATICTSLGLLPIVRVWGLYFLPLQYITWIGVAFGFLGLATFVAQRVRRGPYRYVVEGVPIPARIQSLELRPTVIVNAQPAAYRFFATIEFRDPATGALRSIETSSNDVSAGAKDVLTTSYRVGDYATAVYLNGDLDRTLRLYGFLDLNPEIGLLRRDGAAPGGALTTALQCLVCVGFFGILFWNVYAFSRYQPIEIAPREAIPPGAAGAVVLGGGLMGGLRWGQRRARARRSERNAEAAARGEPLELNDEKQGWFGSHGVFMGLVIVAGSLLLGGMTAACWAFTANALLDRSPPRYRPIQVDEMIAVTHNMIFREYKVEYHFLQGDPAKQSLLSTPAEMDALGGGVAVAEVHAGRFGWPWVKSLLPLHEVLRRNAGAGAGAVRIVP